MEGIPSFRGPPDMISPKSTEDLEKSVSPQLNLQSKEEPGNSPGINLQMKNRMIPTHSRARKVNSFRTISIHPMWRGHL